MVKILPIIMSLITFSFTSCNSQIKGKLESKLKSFNKNDFDKNILNKIYILEGIYKTKNDFNVIIPKLQDNRKENYVDFLKIQDDGKAVFGSSPERKESFKIFTRIDENQFNAVITKEGERVYLYKSVVLHAILGFGGGNKIIKYPVLINNNHIYIQDGNNCFVYKPIN